MMTYRLIITFLLTTFRVYQINGEASFNKVPPAVIYVVEGQTARFVWKYHVDDRKNEFEVNSPRWDFYGSDGPRSIASEDSGHGWTWTTHKDTCPKRLLNRVRKESTATLVITNVTTDDNGVYGCSLVLKISSAVTSKVKLIVTTIPYFTAKPPFTKFIKEGRDLIIPCSASCSPKPNVTWVMIVGGSSVIVSQGLGNASLHISNITRNQNSTYKCQATNNPNEKPVEAETKIIVMFSPEFSNLPPKNKTVIEGMDLEINCSANSIPLPNITWFHLQHDTKVNKSHGIGKATLSLPNVKRDQNGTYECQASNNLSEKATASTVVIVMCYCLSTNSSVIKSNFTANEHNNTQVHSQETELNRILNGKTFMTVLLTVTCVSVLVNILLIIFIFLKSKWNRFKVADRGKETLRFGPPKVEYPPLLRTH